MDKIHVYMTVLVPYVHNYIEDMSSVRMFIFETDVVCLHDCLDWQGHHPSYSISVDKYYEVPSFPIPNNYIHTFIWNDTDNEHTFIWNDTDNEHTFIWNDTDNEHLLYMNILINHNTEQLSTRHTHMYMYMICTYM